MGKENKVHASLKELALTLDDLHRVVRNLQRHMGEVSGSAPAPRAQGCWQCGPCGCCREGCRCCEGCGGCGCEGCWHRRNCEGCACEGCACEGCACGGGR